MGTLKFYVYLCILPSTCICQVKDDPGGSIGPESGDYHYEDGTGKQPPVSEGSESKSTAQQTDDNSGKQTQSAGDIVNVFKKPFINLNQDRRGWPEEKLIFKLMGSSFAETEAGNSYQPSVRSFGFTITVFSDKVLMRIFLVFEFKDRKPLERPLNMGESKQLKDDNFESLEAFIRQQCRKIDDLKEMQKNSGAKEPV